MEPSELGKDLWFDIIFSNNLTHKDILHLGLSCRYFGCLIREATIQNKRTFSRSPVHTDDHINVVAFSPKGWMYATGGTHIDIWCTMFGTRICQLPVSTNLRADILSTGLSFSPQGELIAACNSANEIEIWDLENGLQKMPAVQTPICNTGVGIAFSKKSNLLVVAAENTEIVDAAHGTVLQVLPGVGLSPFLTISGDGKMIATASHFSTELRELASGKQIRGPSHPNLKGSIQTIALTPDANHLLLGVKTAVLIWKISTQNIVNVLASNKTVRSLAISPDGATMAAGTEQGCIELWNLITFELFASLQDPHNTSTVRVVFSPGGRALLAGNSAGNLRLWDLSLLLNK